MKNKSILFESKEDCCGCGTCKVACPKHAITLETDAYGFVYPVIADKLCIDCGICRKVCAYQQKKENNTPKKVYAVSLKNVDKLRYSASGGAFRGIAERCIEAGGIVFGASLISENGKLVVKHCSATTKEKLKKLLGSKYVQSDLSDTFVTVKNYLKKGKLVLYSGTPCQIVSLKAFLGVDYSNLLTIDLVCHGVPSSSMFQDYIKYEEKKLKTTIKDFKFRDKDFGEGFNARLLYSTNGQIKERILPSYKSSYYELFLEGSIYRSNCYKCPYANEYRPGDLTIGDFWGIEEEHPEYLQPDGQLNQSDGISMLMINSEKGETLFNKCESLFWNYPSTFENVSKHNKQLKQPSSPGKNRDLVLKLYKEKGYEAVDRWFWKLKRKEKMIECLKYHAHNDIPKPIRTIAKKVIGRK